MALRQCQKSCKTVPNIARAYMGVPQLPALSAEAWDAARCVPASPEPLNKHAASRDSHATPADPFAQKRALRLKCSVSWVFGAPETIRTSDPCLRRAVLYPTELRARGSGDFTVCAGPRPIHRSGYGAGVTRRRFAPPRNAARSSDRSGGRCARARWSPVHERTANRRDRCRHGRTAGCGC